MSDASTKKMISMYMEEADAPRFLSGFFRSPPENFHTSEEVEIDIERDDEDVAVVVQDLSVGARDNQSTLSSNKGFRPPIYKEKAPINSYKMIKRQPGQDPFQDPNYGANAVREAFRIFRKLENKIRRAIELQAAQVLQAGALTLKDENGNALYTLNFQPKASHFPNAGTAWGSQGYKPLDDIDDLAEQIRTDGKKDPDMIIFGHRAFRDFMANEAVQKQLDNRRMETGEIRPQSRGGGATFQGFIWIGNYRYEMWTYNANYRDPQTGQAKKYIEDDKVIVRASTGRLDLTYGAIPRLVAPDARALPFLPERFSSTDRGLDFTTNAWFTPDGETLYVQAGTRPLTIPTAIDTFGCLTTRTT